MFQEVILSVAHARDDSLEIASTYIHVPIHTRAQVLIKAPIPPNNKTASGIVKGLTRGVYLSPGAMYLHSIERQGYSA